MNPGHPPEMLHGIDNQSDVGDVSSWISVCPRGLWKVQQTQTGERSQQPAPSHTDDASLGYSPRLGSLCQVRVQLKSEEDKADSIVSENRNEKPDQALAEVADVTAFPRCHDSVLQVPLGRWITIRLGEGQCDITEACVEGMRAGEKCEILISPVEKLSDDKNTPLCSTVELKAFTPGKESWEMLPGDKWEWVKSHKERGGVRFRSGDVWGAADSYSRALKLLITLYGHVRERETKEREQELEEQRDTDSCDKTHNLPSPQEFKTTKAELHSNLSLCQLKLNQPEWAKANAAKATQLEPGGAKAWYRLGQACHRVNELEEAKQAFRKLLELQPESPAALKALKNISNQEKETNARLGLRLSKMFS
ncbi:FK506-binding protein-like [Xyrichtys novacula]|nr:FK506-binding protein-like [Xyrichtys novacula]